MQRKLKIVLGLIIAFLLVIDVLQILWVYNTYQNEKEQYDQRLTNAIGDAVLQYRLREMKPPSPGGATFFIVSSPDTISYESQERQLSFRANAIHLDSIEGGLGYSQLVQMQSRHDFNIVIFDSIFKTVLRQQGIQAEYVLDTVRPARSKRVQKDSASNTLVATKAVYPIQNNEFPVKTAQMMVNTYGDLFVYASFKPYPQYVFIRMLLPLASGLLIFLVTNLALLFVWRTIRQQKKISEIKNDFISNMTHELRTPITIATSAIDSILHHHGLDDKKKVTTYLEASKNELLHLDRLVEKILNLSIEEKKHLPLQYETIDLVLLIQTIIVNHQLITSKQVHFHFSPAQKNLAIRADRMHVGNALNNMIDNAIKYAGEPAHIWIDQVVQGDKMIISIKDNGTGIAKEYHAQIFQPFFRVPHGDLHDVKGFGLGLSYVKKVAEAHGGSVEVISEPGKGSEFRFVIPVNNE